MDEANAGDKPEVSEFACTGSDQLLAVLQDWSANYDPQKLKLQQLTLSKEPLDEVEARDACERF